MACKSDILYLQQLGPNQPCCEESAAALVLHNFFSSGRALPHIYARGSCFM
nr:MAG TPA: hypothetical protein [Caudoviricetes sp.]